MCLLAYGDAADAVDEYCRIAESTAREALKRLSYALVDCPLGQQYQRDPNDDADIPRILYFNAT